MTDTSPPLIVVFGHVNGQLETAFSKLAKLHQKNSFSLAIITGNLFSEGQDDEAITRLLSGQIEIPVSTYFNVGTVALPPRVLEKIEKDEEIAINLHFLGKRSITKTSEGVRIVALGGILDTAIVGGQSKEQHLPFHTNDDAKVLKGANSADILVTALWPANIYKGSTQQLPVEPSTIPASEAIAELVAAIKPRYHLSASDFFFEREPFFPAEPSANSGGLELTRFVSIASLDNPAKDKGKAVYAFKLTRDSITVAPPGATISPFHQPAARKRAAEESGGYSRFAESNGHRPKKRRSSPPPGPDRCYFCLSNPNLPTHMIPTIGQEVYLATAKGPLPSATTFKGQGLNFPCHMIIAPVAHVPTVTTASMGETDAASTFKEMTRFREALQAMVSSTTTRKLGAVTWEINRAAAIHAHWQFLPVPVGMIKRGLVEAAFRVEAKNLKLPSLEVREFGQGDEVPGDYLRVWIWGEEETGDDDNNGDGADAAASGDRIISRSLLMRLDEGVRFDLQYPRKAMAKLLRLDDRMVWQTVDQTEEEETADVEAFREAFKPWDFTEA